MNTQILALHRLVCCIVLVGGSIMALLSNAAIAGERTIPFHASYAAVGDPPEIISLDPLLAALHSHASGNATHLGKYTADYPHILNLDTLEFNGILTFVAANGDELYVNLHGQGVPTGPTSFALQMSGLILGGTGRFEGARGTISGPGTADLATLAGDATFDGELILP